MRVLALLATYNERRFVAACIEHLYAHGVETYLIDNSSTDETVEIARRYRGRGLVGLEELPREDFYDWRALLLRKEELAGELEADWFIHLDADEMRMPPPGYATLSEALADVDRQGFNAVNFLEFTFIPTREEPDHDHADFARTLRTYYPFAPAPQYQVKAWKAGTAVSELASSGGHIVSFPGQRVYPVGFPMRHYLFLSVPHAIEKYVDRRYSPEEVEMGWHGWRARARAGDIRLPSRSELRVVGPNGELDASEPRRRHYIDELLSAAP